MKVSRRKRLKQIIRGLGPGIITGAADDDPSGIATYSIAGAQHGTGFLWAPILTWPLMTAVQMMCARIGMVTGQGLATALRKKFPRWVLVIICFALAAANTINIAADLDGMADAAEILTGFNSHYFVVLFGVGISIATIRLRYAQIERALKWLALALLAYIFTAFYIGFDFSKILHDTFIPLLPHTSSAWATLVAILGTTISPYLFFWQTSEEVESQKSKGRKTLKERQGSTEGELFERKVDVISGTLFSNVAMYFIILTTALTLHKSGITHIESSQQAAEALRPLAGNLAYLLYSMGIIGLGLLAIPTLTGSAAYAFVETFGWREGLDLKFRRAKAFYSVVIFSTLIAIAIDFTNLNPIKALYWSAILNGLLAPFLLVVILLIASDKKIMRGQTSSVKSKILVGLTAAIMFAAGIGMFLFQTDANSAERKNSMSADSIYSIHAKKPDGKDVSLDQYQNKVLLIVNVASHCGFTPQYKGLEALYLKYHEKGLEILGFPCNQFGAQEPGDAKEIQNFCTLNYGVTFPLFAKIDVNGTNAHPLYEYLKSHAKGVLGTEGIKWNFTKFLVSRKGEVLERFAPTTTPESIEKDIVAQIEAK